ncbi:MAG: hypothetical protein ACYTHJ_13025 [Planctomycetota bacterium]
MHTIKGFHNSGTTTAHRRPMATLIMIVPVLVYSTIGHAATFNKRTEQKSKYDSQAREDSDSGKGSAEAVISEQLDAAGRRVKAAVSNGELTEAEAWAEWYAARDEILARAAEDGTLSEAEAAAYQREIHKAELSERLKEAGARIGAAAESGEIGEEEARAQWSATKEQLIDTAVEGGEISADDAAEFRREIYKSELGNRLKAAGARIKEAATSGEMTEEEAWAAWHAEREELIGEAEDAGEVSEEVAAAYRQEVEKAEVGQRLKTAVARGELSEEDAWAAWADYNNGTDQLAENLESMVDRGELSAEEAEARLKTIDSAVIGTAVVGPAKGGSPLARIVLRAAKRVDLNGEQKSSIRKIEQQAIRAYHKIARADKKAHRELAEQVKSQIVDLLTKKQLERFESALEHLEQRNRRAKQIQRRQN